MFIQFKDFYFIFIYIFIIEIKKFKINYLKAKSQKFIQYDSDRKENFTVFLT